MRWHVVQICVSEVREAIDERSSQRFGDHMRPIRRTRAQPLEVEVAQDLQRLEIDMQRLAAATRQDMLLFEARLEARFERGFRQVVVTTSSLLVTGFIATLVATIVAR